MKGGYADMEEEYYVTQGNIEIKKSIKYEEKNKISEILKLLEEHRGAVFSCNYEYPGRYQKREVGFVHPAIELRCYQKEMIVQVLTQKSYFLYKKIKETIETMAGVRVIESRKTYFRLEISSKETVFSENERSKQPSIFNILRGIYHLLFYPNDSYLGLYGAFGYDLIFQFEKEIPQFLKRFQHQEDLVLYIPQELFVNDKRKEKMYTITYEIVVGDKEEKEEVEDLWNTKSYLLPEPDIAFEDGKSYEKEGEYANLVKKAMPYFKKGELFEVVPSRVISKKTSLSPSQIYHKMTKKNPSPYNFFIHLGKEILIGSSPEMFVRVEKSEIETCPISGTIKRGSTPLEDANNIKKLLNSQKEEKELTMCTDVDRNDKSRICVPGSVKVMGRRQIELYSHLIHTVDHIKGRLEQPFDLFDGFLTHMWAVTVTGAPKIAAMKWIEEHEKSPRRWYGGAIGMIRFDGSMDTGLTLRTIRLYKNIAQIRVGATLLLDSIPKEEEEETKIKAQVLLESILEEKVEEEKVQEVKTRVLEDKNILLIDYEDSFVHTLSSYMKRMGGMVTVIRYHYFNSYFENGENYDLVVLSPGPGHPSQYNINQVLARCEKARIPVLGICLGLQGIVTYYGGKLETLEKPRHGIAHHVTFKKDVIGIEEPLEVGLYHSIYASQIPNILEVLAEDEEGIVMAVGHKKLPVIGLQFHPESILSEKNRGGERILEQILELLQR